MKSSAKSKMDKIVDSTEEEITKKTKVSKDKKKIVAKVILSDLDDSDNDEIPIKKESNKKNTNKSGSKTTKEVVKKTTKETDKKTMKETDKKTDKKATKEADKKVDKKTTKEADDECDFEDKIEEIRQELKDNYLQQKKLMNDFKELMTLHKKEVKLTAKSGNRSNSGKNTGFNKPEPIPMPLKKILKIKEDMLPRSKITALMYQYFTDNKMYNKKTKKEIIPNQKIREIFGMEDNDVINFYNLQTWLKKVYNENSTNNAVLNIDD